MIDLMFVELGAVVTEIKGPTRCTVEPFCDPKAVPTYGAECRIEIDFAALLDNVLAERGWVTPVALAVQRARFDQIPGHRSPLIGPSWPGGGYEGVVGIRADVVTANPTLAKIVAALPEHPWEYQVVASIDEGAGEVRRYHGFHAEVVKADGDTLVLAVANAGAVREVRYDPADTKAFYAGALVADTVVTGGATPRKSGAVFISPEAAASFGLSLPKRPPAAGL